jgi:hypothetical protein
MALVAYKTSGVVPGSYYRTRYRVANVVGFGAYSDVTYILAANLPTTPSAPTVNIVGINAIISWALPYNGGSEITSAYIQILEDDGVSYVPDTTDCDGSTEAIF